MFIRYDALNNYVINVILMHKEREENTHSKNQYKNKIEWPPIA